MHNDRYGRTVPEDPKKDRAMARFSENADLENLYGFLEGSSVDRHETMFIMLHDPAYRNLSFSQIARKAGVTLQELQQLYTDGMRQIALLRMSNALPQVMADVAEDAKSKMETCSRCDGNGVVPTKEGTRTCPLCKGEQEIRRSGDTKAREMLLESAKMIRQSGPLVAIQNNNLNVGDSRMEDMLKRTRQIVLEPKAIEAKESQ